MLYEDKVGENSPDIAENRRFLAPRHDRSPPAEAQASFDNITSITWLSGKSAPTSPKVAGSNPDFRNFSAKNWKFSEKSAPDTASPTIAHPRRVAPAVYALHVEQ